MSVSTFNPLGRTRSLRQSTASTTSTTSTNLLKLPSTSNAQLTSGPSNVNLFITNLRLLELDLREDWPDITAVTFSTKDAQQNQKKRIQCVEWALYQLFAVWDPEEAQNKLQPFFPPLEPLQSLNLRAALFRCLEQAKKNGVLGRDMVLRKTMLDECKGERLEEVLAVFSNVVLKKAIQNDTSGRYEAIAQQLALENFSYTGERTILSALILAHKVSISRRLEDKDVSRVKYNDFATLLNLKDEQTSQRQEQLSDARKADEAQPGLSERETRALQSKLRKNWSGSNEWLETILHGDNKSSREGLLGTRFDKLWKSVEDGTFSDTEGSDSSGLVKQLATRVKEQENRLARWQDFGRTLTENGTKSPTKKSQPTHVSEKGINLNLSGHQSLQVGKSTSAQSEKPSSASLEEYTALIEATRHALKEVNTPKPALVRPLRSNYFTRESQHVTSPGDADMSTGDLASPNEGGDAFSRSSSIPSPDDQPKTQPDEISESPSIPTFDSPPTTPRAKLSRRPISVATSSTHPPEQTSPDSQEEASPEVVTLTPKRWRPPIPKSSRSVQTPPRRPMSMTSAPSTEDEKTEIVVPPTLKRAATSPVKISPPVQDSTESQEPPKVIIPELDQAEQILNSMSAASPSPMKPKRTLSLAERTRLTMARTSNLKYSDPNDDFDDLPDIDRLSLKPKPTPAKKPPAEEDKHADLIERTRQSMAGFEAAQKKAQLERSKSLKDEKRRQRQSKVFPKVEGEEPPTPAIDREVLMGGDVDYESVFMSRPRIATSPAAVDRTVLGDSEGDEMEGDEGEDG
ncbi:HAUS augmin-like complex subunit 6 N-terminus-domain-containing protein [Rutstroemia sp. NJR-2017a WRK4]|nr:HAUS augmin-like complex subunit 6 N-terminus-domain-containing protein [Rutstroemia sp. NJR-2017a WRK4]